MSSFTSPLELESTGRSDSKGRPIYRLKRRLVYEIGARGSDLFLIVPQGHETNLATVPKFLAWMYPGLTKINGKHIAAPVLHDYLTNEQFPGFKLKTPSGVSRWFADTTFREAMKVLGVPRWKRLTAYFAVRLYAIVKRI